MLETKVILYDDSCPMCKVYTRGFVQLRILRPENRVGLAHASPDLRAHLDLNRARHEIPLLDTETGEVTYGMDTLFTLIGHRFPFFNPLFRIHRFRAFVYAFYQIVTYNRRVIAGCAPPRNGFNCAPDFNREVRLRYLRLALGVWAALLIAVVGRTVAAHQPLLAGLLMSSAVMQALPLRSTRKSRCSWDRAGGSATDNLLFALLLVPSLLPLTAAFRWANFGFAATVTLLDVRRRRSHCKGCACFKQGRAK